MLRTGFVGSNNLFGKFICAWLRQHSDLRLVVWTDQLRWSATPGRSSKIVSRYRARAKRYGWWRVADEILYYGLYRTFLSTRDSRKLRQLLEEMAATLGRRLETAADDIRQIHLRDIGAPEVVEGIQEERLDVLFAVCVDVLLPESIINAPRLGSYLWHEGITPDYRGVYPAFWTLVNKDYGKLGYTLLRMTMKLDAGEVFVQGTVNGVDPMGDSHGYIGHKAILESLEDTKRFLQDLERGEAVPLERVPSEDRLYSYPTASALAKISWDRWRRKSFRWSSKGRTRGQGTS